MDAEIKKIMNLVANGSITKEQGDILLKALKEKNSNEYYDEDEIYNQGKPKKLEDTVINLGDKIGKTVTMALNKTGKLLSELNIDEKINQAFDESIREIKKGKKNFSIYINDKDDEDYDEDEEHGDIDITFNEGITEKKKYIKPDDNKPYEDREICIKFINSKRVIKREYTVQQFMAAPESLDKAVNMALSFTIIDLINERFTGLYKYINNDIVLKVRIY